MVDQNARVNLDIPEHCAPAHANEPMFIILDYSKKSSDEQLMRLS